MRNTDSESWVSFEHVLYNTGIANLACIHFIGSTVGLLTGVDQNRFVEADASLVYLVHGWVVGWHTLNVRMHLDA
jgi:hypothetical protein